MLAKLLKTGKVSLHLSKAGYGVFQKVEALHEEALQEARPMGVVPFNSGLALCVSAGFFWHGPSDHSIGEIQQIAGSNLDLTQ